MPQTFCCIRLGTFLSDFKTISCAVSRSHRRLVSIADSLARRCGWGSSSCRSQGLKFEASSDDDDDAIAASGNSLLLKWRAMFCWLPLRVGFGFGFGFISGLSPSCSGHWLFRSVCHRFPAALFSPSALMFFFPLVRSLFLIPLAYFILYFKSFLWCIIRLPAVDSVDGTKCSAIHFNGSRRPPVIPDGGGNPGSLVPRSSITWESIPQNLIFHFL